MKSILLSFLLVTLAFAQSNTNQCSINLKPSLELQFYPAFPDPPNTDVLLVVWRTMCPLWRIETSGNLVEWIPYGDSYYNYCDVTNNYQTNCVWHIIERPFATKQTFYRLKLYP